MEKRVQRSKTYKAIVSEKKNIFADRELRITTLIVSKQVFHQNIHSHLFGNARASVKSIFPCGQVYPNNHLRD